MADIFLSYAREDTARAQQLASALESRGWSVWWDRHILHGQPFTEHIQQQLDEARCIIVLWSKAALKSPFVRDEAAEGLDGRLVPLLLEMVKQPLGFRQLHAADFTDWTGEGHHDEFERTIASITSLVAPQVAVVSTPPHAASGPTQVAPVAAAALPSGLEFDFFISYAHIDNVELVEGRTPWVTEFRRALETRVGQLLGRQVKVSMGEKPAWAELMTADAIDAVERSTFFVAIVSPRYIRSEFALRELAEFEKAAERQGGMIVGGRSRLFKVLKTPVPLAQTPEALQRVLGYEFYRIEPETGRVREFAKIFGPDAEHDFWLKLDDLAYDISSLIQ